MKRITGKDGRGRDSGVMNLAWQRLTLYEDLHQSLELEQQELTAQLLAMRAAGKEKTATYRDLMTKKLQNAYVLSLFTLRGL